MHYLSWRLWLLLHFVFRPCRVAVVVVVVVVVAVVVVVIMLVVVVFVVAAVAVVVVVVVMSKMLQTLLAVVRALTSGRVLPSLPKVNSINGIFRWCVP